VKVRPDGTVKVLDFGLAKATDQGGLSAGGATDSPTLTARATQMGMIIGTAAYMAPEQAKGKVADRRVDVWAFGCVVYEMLTGRRTFGGDDVSNTLGSSRNVDVGAHAVVARRASDGAPVIAGSGRSEVGQPTSGLLRQARNAVAHAHCLERGQSKSRRLVLNQKHPNAEVGSQRRQS
jgi:serine/threonine protein kinase